MNDLDLFCRYASNTDYLTTDDLLLFLEAEQGVRSEESFPKHRIQMNHIKSFIPKRSHNANVTGILGRGL